MSDTVEQTTEETTEPKTEETQGTEKPKSWREEAGAQAVFKQLSEYQAKIAAYEKEKASAAEEARQRELEAKNDWETLAAEEKRKREELERTHASTIRSLELKAAFAGITDDIARAGAIAQCPPDADPIEAAEALKEKRPELWQTPGIQPGATPPQGAASGGSTKQSLKDKLASGDDEVMRNVFADLMAGKAVTLD